MNGDYSPPLVALSLLIAVFASYTALDLATGVAIAQGRVRLAWIAAGALAMGVGIWSMHFVGMLAFRMPGMAILYDVPLLLLSVAVAVVASGLALYVIGRDVVSRGAMLGAALAMGGAIAGMHYIGIWSMRMPAHIIWDDRLVALSIAIAVIASLVALALARRCRFDRSARGGRIRAGGGLLMGLAISGMHYTAMAAARFVPRPATPDQHAADVLATPALGVAVAGTTLLILAVAVAGSAVSRELARRHAIATELTTAEARLRGIIDSALDALVATDAQSTIIEWNRNAETIFGWTADEAIGKNLSETIIPPRYRAAHQQGVARFLATGEARILNRRVEISALRKDGTEFPIELTIAPLRTGAHPLFTSFIRDITQQKQAEVQRREGEEREQRMREMERERARLSALFEEAPAFIAVLHGPDHVFELSNTRYDQIIGHRPLVGRPIREALPELADQGYVGLLDRVYATGEPYVGVGSRVLLQVTPGAPLEERYVNFVYQPIAGADGTTTGIFVHGVDVTDIVRARHEAERANQAKNEFLSRMSHELRTPLNAILGFGQLLELEAVTEANRESADQIVRAGKHLLGLIDEVLEISRIEGGQLGLSVEPVSVSQVVSDSLELVEVMAARQGIALQGGAMLNGEAVLADRQRLKQVLLNLLSNAIKYNRPGGSVTLTCEAAGDGRLRIVVSDTGRGIPAEQQWRLFTPFDRLGAEQSDVEGAGLGLALSRGLMEAMGGSLGVESEQGRGSRFWAELPSASPGSPEATGATRSVAPVPADAPAPETRHTVLVVEDNLANVRLMERIFQRRPHVKLLTAMQGRLGLEMALQHRPGLVLLDLNLPDMSGYDVLIALRENPVSRGIPVVMVSGDAIPAQVQRSLDLGALAYLTKPFSVHELLELVDRTLQQLPA